MSNVKDQLAVITTFQKVFNTDDGKVVLDYLSRYCSFQTPMFNGDANQLIFNEGKRNVFLFIQSYINSDPKKLEEMLKGQSED